MLVDRREFEDRLAVELDRARADGTLVAVIVGELLGMLVVHSRFGFDAGDAAIDEAIRRVMTAVEGEVDLVGRIGETELALLLTGVGGRDDAVRLMARIEDAFVEPVQLEGGAVEMNLAMGVNIGPGRRRTDMDLLWRTAEDSTHAHSATLQRLVSDVQGEARNLEQVAQAFADEGVARFGLEACQFEIGDRRWHAPPELPARPPDDVLPLETAGRRIGLMRLWGRVPDESDSTGVSVLLGHVAAALDRASAVDEFALRARTDSLTGLLNREGLARELTDLAGSYAVGVIDLDHFKRVNDVHGHDIGDRVLSDLAHLLLRGRTDDLVARWGGEEIVVVMPGTTTDGAVARLTRLLEEAKTFVRIDGVEALTFSAGVTLSDASEPFSAAVRRADDAMYRAKRAGRARIEVA